MILLNKMFLTKKSEMLRKNYTDFSGLVSNVALDKK